MVWHFYKVTSTNAETGEESLSAVQALDKNITAATNAYPVNITSAGHSLVEGDEVEINDVVGMIELNGRRFVLQDVTADSFSLAGEDGRDYGVYTSGGRANRTFVGYEQTERANVSGNAAYPHVTLRFNAVPGASRYSIYREQNGSYGWIGDTVRLEFTDMNITPDYSLTPPTHINPFHREGDYPSISTFYQQRQVFGGTRNQPDTMWYSVVGAFHNMSRSSPGRPDDSITATLTSPTVDTISGFMPLEDLLVFTAGSEWRVNSGDSDILSAETLNQRPQTYWGSGDLGPIVMDEQAIFITGNGAQVRTLGYSFEKDGYAGVDLTLFVPHLLKYFRATSWAFSRPDSRVFIVREDGVVLVLTFDPKEKIVAWTTWDSLAQVKDVAVTTPYAASHNPVPYFITEHTYPGSEEGSVTSVVITDERRFSHVNEAYHLDFGVTRVYEEPQTEIKYLWHLDGRRVTALADGQVYGDLLVEGGKITLQTPAYRVHVGISYISEIETLNPELQIPGETIQGKQMRVVQATARVKDTRGLEIGTADGDFHELRPRNYEPLGAPTDLVTGDIEQTLSDDFEGGGKVRLRQKYPLPMTVLALYTELELGGDLE